MFVKKEDVPSEINEVKLKVLEIKEDYCVGCGLCVKLLPEYYEMKGNKAVVRGLLEHRTITDLVKQSVQKCPTKAIVINGTEA